MAKNNYNTALGSLVAELDRFSKFTIALSGGIDSMVLAFVATRFSKGKVRIVHATSSAVPTEARERIEVYTRRYDWNVVYLDAREAQDPDYTKNPINRCYYCKKNLYTRILEVFPDSCVFSGTNLDDLGDYRPGLIAADEHKVVHPYVNAGIKKDQIYALARGLNLYDLQELPASPCLASRVETGIAVKEGDLRFIDESESAVKDILGRNAVVRCRVVHSGVVLELAEMPGEDSLGKVRRTVEQACAREGRVFSGIKPYAKGSAFLMEAS